MFGIGNLLNLAHSVIPPQAFEYYAFTGRNTQTNGIDVNTYALPAEQRGSVQPVPQNMYQQLGLEFNHQYFTFFVSKNVMEVNRDVSGDYMMWQGKKYKCLSVQNWFSQDGWLSVLCIEVLNV